MSCLKVSVRPDYGKGTIMRLGDDISVNVEALSTGSLSLDMALGIGGVPRGRIIEIYGPEASGKTTLALHVVASAQKAGGEAAYIDVEHALEPAYAKALGVDIDSLLISQPDTGEQALGDSLRGIHIITKESERLTRMVAELLEFTRIQDGRFNLRIELIDIAAELEDALFTYGEIMKQAGIEINYSSPESEIPLIPGDPERLKQVFTNVLDNASKHGQSDKIDVSLWEDKKFVHISFRDYGRT